MRVADLSMRARFLIIPLFYFVVSVALSAKALSEPSYHVVGWVNTFVPGGGQLLLGDYWSASSQALAEIGTFGLGYHLSARSPMTLDGVPEEIPSPKLLGQRIQTRGQYCAAHPGASICTRGSPNDLLQITSFDNTHQNIQRALAADILQEIGIKYHMVNVFNAYREAAKGDPNIDPTPTGELFLAPFRWSLIEDPAVYIPLGVSAAAIAVSYVATVKGGGVTPTAKFTGGSNRLYALTYGTVFPFGGAVPEEMFYRGFIQNEARGWVDSPFFAVPFSTALYTLSHSVDEMPSAAVSGAWLGTIAYLNNGRLSRGIAYHFWANFLAGLMEIELLQRSQFYPHSTDLFDFTWYF